MGTYPKFLSFSTRPHAMRLVYAARRIYIYIYINIYIYIYIYIQRERERERERERIICTHPYTYAEKSLLFCTI
jgi:hypothetical protein